MLLWLCHGVAAMDVVQVAVQPLRVQLRSGQSVTIFEVVNQDDALDAAIADDSDPFGAVCWPASVAAANELAALADARRGGRLDGVRVLELGAGPGLASVAAAGLGADVVATDVSAVSLRLLAAARDAAPAGAPLTVRRLDITDAAAVRALAASSGAYDVVVASDTLYQADIAVATAAALGALRPAVAVVCDPGRDGRGAFLAEAKRLGLAAPDADFRPAVVAPLETRALRLAVDRPAGTTIGVFRAGALKEAPA